MNERPTRPLLSVVGVVLICALLTAAADPSAAQPSTAMEKAAELGVQARWAEAVEILENAVQKEERNNAAAWYQLARAYEQTARWDDVLVAVGKARKKGFSNRGLLHLAMARAHAELGRQERALAEVEALASEGASRFLLQALHSSSSLAPLQEDPRFLAAAKRLTPCTALPYRQFDFWIGDFRVEDPAGNVVGENEITRYLDGCLLMESWKGASGMHGMSINYYDPADETWNQIFVDNNGKPRDWPPLKGKLEKDGSMVLWSPKGRSRTRWTWKQVDGGKVRQTADQTSDGGKTWRVIWDSFYVPKSSS